MDMVLRLADIHPRDRVAYWHELACKAFVRHECQVTSSSALNATIDCVRLGELGLVNIESRGLECVERTIHNIAHGDDDVFLLCVQLHGSATICQDGREAVIYPGDSARRPAALCLPLSAPQADHHQDPAPLVKGAPGVELAADGACGAANRQRRGARIGLHGISVRYANILLSSQGTSLERLIVSRQLDHCRRALEDPGQVHRTITEVAFAWGFSDLSHFNRRFKAEYGCGPRDYRQRFQS